MNKNEYNDWTNYETWLVNLWLKDDSSSVDYWIEAARDLLCNEDPATVPDGVNRVYTTNSLAERLKNEIEQCKPEGFGTGLFCDLLDAALSEVNWFEIAESFIEAAVEKQP